MNNEIYSGFIRLHILYHASKEPIFGLGIIEELKNHGYNLSPGTLYPILHKMEDVGYLKSEKKQVGKKIRRLYEITPGGVKALLDAKMKIKELFQELIEEQ